MEEHLQWRSYNQSAFQSREEHSSRQQSSNSLQQTLLKLYTSKTRFLKFTQDIGALKQTSLSNLIVKYCSSAFKKTKCNLSNLNFNILLDIIDKRIEKMRKTKSIKRNWGQEDLKILVWLVSKYCEFKKIKHHEKQLDIQDWNFIAGLIPGVTGESCMFKWLSLKMVTLTDYNWTQQQSKILKGLVNARKFYNTKHCSQIKDWRQISKELYNLNTNSTKCYRNPKQCREHWTCFLNEKVKKGPWTLQEDVKLFTCIHRNQGNKKWSEIVKFFEGRTENALKNRYNLVIQKLKKKYSKNYSEAQLMKIYIEQNYLNQFTNENMSYQMQQFSNEQFFKKEFNYDFYNEQSLANKTEEKQNGDTRLQVKVIDMSKLGCFSNEYLMNLQPGFLNNNGSFTRLEKDDALGLFIDNGNEEYSNDLSINDEAFFRCKHNFT